jgi:hypothetical protein
MASVLFKRDFLSYLPTEQLVWSGTLSRIKTLKQQSQKNSLIIRAERLPENPNPNPGRSRQGYRQGDRSVARGRLAGGAQLGAQIVDLARARGEPRLRPPPRLDLPGEVGPRFGEVGLEIGEVRPELEVVRSGYRSPCISLGREQRRGLAQPQRLTW